MLHYLVFSTLLLSVCQNPSPAEGEVEAVLVRVELGVKPGTASDQHGEAPAGSTSGEGCSLLPSGASLLRPVAQGTRRAAGPAGSLDPLPGFCSHPEGSVPVTQPSNTATLVLGSGR